MRARLTIQRVSGFSSLDMLTMVGVLAVLSFVVWPLMSPRPVRCGRSNCVSNLKQVGLSLRMWANDQQERFPWAVSTNEGGTLELIGSSVYPHLLALSNELSSPRVFLCPSDTARMRAMSWDQFTNDTQASYFLGVDATEVQPQMLLSGDRNITTNGLSAFGLATLTRFTAVGWKRASLHGAYGNVGLADGSAQQMSSAELLRQVGAHFTNLNAASVRLAIP